MSFIDINNYISSYTEILPGLWLGNEAASQDENFIRRHNISLIVNCSKKIPNRFANIPGMDYVRLSVNDPGPLTAPSRNQDNIDMITLIPWAANIIHEALENGKNVLVHCHAGAQRSANVIVYYLMKYGAFAVTPQFAQASPQQRARILYNTVVNYVVSKRPFVYYGGLNNNFKYALEQILGTSL